MLTLSFLNKLNKNFRGFFPILFLAKAKVLILLLVLFFLDYNTSLLQSSKDLIRTVTFSIFQTTSVSINKLKTIGYNLKNIFLSSQEDEDFKILQLEYQQLKQDYNKIFLENESLRTMLKNPARVKSTICIAQVIAVQGSFGDSFLTINKGLSDGIQSGQAVLSHAGLLGKIKAVYENYSQVETIFHKNSKIPAQGVTSKEKGLLKPFDQKLLIFKYFPGESQIQLGETLYTTRFEELYPEGLAIGKVVAFEDESPLVQPYVNPFHADFVMVLN